MATRWMHSLLRRAPWIRAAAVATVAWPHKSTSTLGVNHLSLKRLRSVQAASDIANMQARGGSSQDGYDPFVAVWREPHPFSPEAEGSKNAVSDKFISLAILAMVASSTNAFDGSVRMHTAAEFP